MDVTVVGLQNAGKTSLVRVLAVSCPLTIKRYLPLDLIANMSREENSQLSMSSQGMVRYCH